MTREKERRLQSHLRVPFVRRCRLTYEDSREKTAFLVNISPFGAYVAEDDPPTLGRSFTCRFSLPGNERDVTVIGVVVWLNPRQRHAIHSLPPGFGFQFREMTDHDRGRIETFLVDYVNRLPQRSRNSSGS